MDQPKMERVLRLMIMLTGNDTLTVDAIARRLGISARTVYRYVDTFRMAGFVIKKDDDVIRLDVSSRYFKEISELVHFSEEEAFILKSAIESIDENNVLKQNLKKKLCTVYNYKILAETIVHPKDAGNVKSLVDAISQRKQVVLHDYASAHGSTVRNRKVEVFGFTTNYIQIWCYEPESESIKLFKVARIGSVEILGDNWQFEQKHKTGFLDVFRMHSAEVKCIRLKLNLRAANLLVEEYPLAAKDLTTIDTEHYVLETRVCSYLGIGRFVLGLMDDIEIESPRDFKAYIKQHLKLSLKKISASKSSKKS